MIHDKKKNSEGGLVSFNDVLACIARKERSALEKYEGLREEIKKMIEDDIIAVKFLRHVENLKIQSKINEKKLRNDHKEKDHLVENV